MTSLSAERRPSTSARFRACQAPAPATSQPEAISSLLKALADPLRMEVALSLASGERCVCELTEALGLAQSRLSFHLKVMRQAGLISAREEGRWVYYRLEPETVGRLRQWLHGLETLCGTPAKPCH